MFTDFELFYTDKKLIEWNIGKGKYIKSVIIFIASPNLVLNIVYLS